MYTTIHIEEFEVAARDTKLGKEEITRDIPNVGDEALRDLDESGIVRIGAEVRQGDILPAGFCVADDSQRLHLRITSCLSGGELPRTSY